jgi:L-amino acid N-acyltransferase YncA
MSVAFSAEQRRAQTAAAEELTMRDATVADLPAIVAIYNSTVGTRMVTAELEPTTVEARLPWLREHTPDHHPIWVTESDGQIAGWLSVQDFLPRCAYRGTVELSVYVDEKFRRRGIARKLLEQAIARARSLEISAMVGFIFAHNEPSLKLFEQLGFQRWGLLPRVAKLDGVERDLTIVGRQV